MRSECSCLPDLFGTDARGGDVRYGAVFKFDAGVRGIDLVGDHWDTDGPDLAHFHVLTNEPLDRIKIMDHHVEHDVNIKRTIWKRRDAVDLEI